MGQFFDDFVKFDLHSYVKLQEVKIMQVNVHHSQKILGLEMKYNVHGKELINHTNTLILKQKLAESTYVVSEFIIEKGDAIISIAGCFLDDSISVLTLQTKNGVKNTWGMYDMSGSQFEINLPFTYKYIH